MRLSKLIQKHIGILILCTAFISCTLIYAHHLPAFEGIDEAEHIAYVLHLRQTGTYPDLMTDFETPIRQQTGQMPLYYTVAALISSPFDVTGLTMENLNRNPWANSGLFSHNRNYFMMSTQNHMLSLEQYQAAQFASFLRLTSMMFGVVAVSAVYWAGLILFKGERSWALLAALFFGLTPITLQTFATVTNDAASIALSVLIMGAALRLYFDNWNNPSWLIFTGLLMGLAALAKVNTLAMWGVPALAILLGWLKSTPATRRWSYIPALLKAGLTTLMTALLVASWWYIRNFILYGDAFGLQRHTEMYWALGEARSIFQAIAGINGFWYSFWMTGGMGDVHPSFVFFSVPILIVTIGMIGLFVHARHLNLSHFLLMITAVGGIIILVRWMQLMDNFPMGRLYLPYLPALILLVVEGYRRIAPARPIIMGMAGSYGALVLIIVIPTLHQHFGRPPLYDTLPDGITPINLDFRVGYLVGFHVVPVTIEPEAQIPVTVCWQAPDTDAPVPVPYPFTVQFFAINDNTGDLLEPMVTAVQFDSYTGLGRYTLWQARKIFCDSFSVRATEAARPDFDYKVYITLYDRDTLAVLPAFSPEAGHYVWPVVGVITGTMYE